MGDMRFIDVDHDDEKTYTLREAAATSMQSLPEELQEEILVRLPLKSVSICRCVHKLWLKLLCSREFAKNHAIHSYNQINNIPELMVRDYDTKTKSPLIYSIDYASISSSLLSSCESCKGASCESCKGVICREPILMENPFKHIAESIKNIPIGQIRKRDAMFDTIDKNKVRYGFGYDCRISDYKLVRIEDYDNTGCFNVQVYSLRSDSWRSTQTNFPYIFALQARPSGLLFNGALHWLGTLKGSSESVIISFDISNERLWICHIQRKPCYN
ncbi:F-box/kelch-repeat protein At3g23880-like [Papaver somniferum]|uniref:F-box/kelch-repeat protein At3g23880-like n=1 Tax=Papaver somniferum TaxID=3469 RepID=UPI000E701DA1|nr:F-box/kelch-repeat protein At3g23880-like [Papaver somniferum]